MSKYCGLLLSLMMVCSTNVVWAGPESETGSGGVSEAGAKQWVDISTLDKVEVGSWGDLKDALADSDNAGKAIVLTGNITAEADNPIDTVAGSGMVIDGNGFTITGKDGTSGYGQFIRFNSSDKTDLVIQNVKLENFGNVLSSGSAEGGAIYNYKGTIGDISGDFSDNSAQSTNFSASGGAIYNWGSSAKIGDISGDFSDNFAQGNSGAYGGAIYNFGEIGNISGDFSGNYAKSETGSAYGGAIDNGGTIGDISGDFSDNSAQSTNSSAYGGAVYNWGSSAKIGDISGDFSGNFAKSVNYASGGAIYNDYGTIGNIRGDFSGNHAQSEKSNAYGGAVYNRGTIGNISGDFSGNSAQSTNSSAYGGAIYNYNGTIGDISGDFSGNFAKSVNYAYGGAIYNDYGTIGNIRGDFSDNYAKSENSSASGGAIYNWGSSAKIGDISGDFSGNHAQSEKSKASGGAIYNDNGTIGEISGDFNANYAKSETGSASGGAIANERSPLVLVNSSFYDNYVETGASKDSAMGQMTMGGAIYSTADLTIKADKGDSIFSGNKVKWADGEDSSAITMILEGASANLFLDSRNEGLIQFDDKISSLSGLDVMLINARANGATVSDDGAGGYIVDMGSQQIHLKKTDGGFLYTMKQQEGISESEVQSMLSKAQAQGCEIRQDGDNYFVIDSRTGQYFEFTKQEDGTYIGATGMFLSENGANITITGDDSSQVVFNNAVDGFGTIDISGTNVAINQGVGTFSRSIVHDGGVLNVNNGATAADTIINNLGTMNVNEGGVSNRVAVNSGAILNVEGGTANDNTLNSGAVMNVNAGESNRTEVNENAILTVAGGTANDNTINSQGRVEVNAGGTANRNNVEDGGVLHVATNGVAQNTTVNSGGQLITEDKATVNNLLANDGANLNIDAGSYLVGNIILHAGAIMEGTYDYSQIFKDDVLDAGSLTLVGGLNDILTENSLINTTADKKLNLTAGEYAIGDGAQAVKGWDMLKVKDNATVKLEGNIELTGPNKKLIVENGSTLDLAGHSPSNYVITGSVSNDGLMSFTHTDDEADDVTTIEGNYKAYNNAKMSIDVDPINNVSDLLRIDGDVEGKTDVILNSTVYEGKPTALIKFVEAQNDDLTTGAAFNIYRVVNSAYEWNSLYKDGAWYTGTTDLISDGSESGYGDINTGNMEDDEDLESDAELPEKPEEPDNPGDGGNNPNPSNPRVVGEAIAYMGLPSAGIEQTRSMMQAVSDKVSATKVYYGKCCGFYDYVYNYGGLSNAWVNPVYSYSKVKSPYNYEAEISGLEGGFDIQSDTYNRLGVFASFRQGDYDFDGRGDDYTSKVGSTIDIDSYILGLYHRYDAGKAWVMSQVFAGYQDVDFASDDGVSSNTDGIEFGGSVAMGLVFNPWRGITVEPIARVSYTQINYDNAKDRYGKTAKFSDVRNVEIEGGLRLEKSYNRRNGYAKIYFQPSIIQNIGSGDVTVTSLSKVHGLENSTLGRVAIGGSMSFDDKWSGFANTSYTFGSDYNNLMVNMGVNYAF